MTADVGTGIPLSLDRSTPPDNWTGTALQQLLGKIGDIGTGTAGLFEHAQLGLENLLNPYVWAGEEPKRTKLPVAPGLQAAGDAATFATGGLTSSLFPAAGAIRQGMQWAAPAARETAREATAAFPGLLADDAGTLNLRRGLTPRQLQSQTLTLDRPMSAAPDLPVGEYPTAPGHNLGPRMDPEPFAPPVPAARERQVAPRIPASRGERVGAVQDRYAKTHGWTQGPQRRFWEEPAYQAFKVDDLPRAPRPGEVRSTAEIGPGWKPLFGPGSILGSLLGLIGGGAAAGNAEAALPAAPGQAQRPDALRGLLQSLGAY
jgi:hypothetical protein